MNKWEVISTDQERLGLFDTKDEAVDFFNKTIGAETHGKDHWCDLFDECVWEVEHEKAN